MNQDIKKEWVAALRSGSYTQGKNALKQEDVDNPGIFRHCCLGVLCEVAVKHNIIAPFIT